MVVSFGAVPIVPVHSPYHIAVVVKETCSSCVSAHTIPVIEVEFLAVQISPKG
jgi:hypothetical protein